MTKITLKPLIIPGSSNWNRIHSTRLNKYKAIRQARKARAELKRNIYTLICLVLFIIIYGNIAARLI